MAIFFAVMLVILILSNSLYYLSNKSLLERQAVQQNELISEQLNLDIEQSQAGQSYINNMLGDKLRMASLVAEYALPPKASDISNQQLKALAKKIGVNNITLLQKVPGDIVGVKSSDPKEVGLSTKNMGLWYQAFQDLWNGNPSASKFGKSAPNFWTGPFTNASSNPNQVDKFGYYYDGSTDYIIDPFIETSSLELYAKDVGAPSFIERLQKSDAEVLAIAVLNKTFGEKPITYSYKGSTWVDVSNQPVMYGRYLYPNVKQDVASKNEAYQTNQVVSTTDVASGRKVLKTFVPEEVGKDRYVVEVVTDYNVVSRTLHEQLENSLLISIGLLLLLIAASYVASGFIIRPLRRITDRVDRIAHRDFDQPVDLRRTDEIGVLAERVDLMANNLLGYLHESARKERGVGVDYFVMVTHALIHELRHPLVSLKYLLEFFPRVQHELSPQGEEVFRRMGVSTQYASSVVAEFNDFLKNGKLKLKEENLIEVVHDALQVASPLVEVANVSLELVVPVDSDEIVTLIDKDKLRMVFVNLIKNALDAIADVDRDGHIQVEIRRERDRVCVDIFDNGRGIPMEEWESIFMPYHSTKKTGIGLGLTFCGLVVVSHGGIVHVTESTEEGTLMEMTLPIVR